MTKKHEVTVDLYGVERAKIMASGIVEALVEHALGKRYMSYTQVRAALGLLKKVLPDLSTVVVANKPEKETEEVSKALIEYRIVDPA
ncbi:hypothetical protein [Taklimakanibacter lacteus]|uniref:hypothetical protein n=1 Tax=Taklimakanibacter lacteus TaxID=2268456 RepID=UPI000E66607D